MGKRYIFLFFLVTGILNTLSAQCPPPGFPDAGDDCPSAPILCVTLDGYCNTINNNNVPQPFPGCGGQWTLNNDEWFAFYAGSTTITIEVVPSNCNVVGGNEGLQGGIYFGCGGPVMDVQCNCTTNAFTLTSTNFVVGEIYWMVLDGCGGSVCDYDINVLQGSTAGGPPADPGNISGPITVCQGDTEAYSLLPVDAATIYNWVLTPALGSVSPNDNNANITWSTPGTAQLCIDVANACFANPNDNCITIEVIPTPSAVLSGSGSVCNAGTATPVDLTVNFTGTAPWQFTYFIDGVPQPPITTSDNPYTLTVNTFGNVQIGGLSSTTGGCPGNASGAVMITETFITPAATGTDPLCFGDSDGSVSVSVSGGSSPYSYQWAPSGSGQNPGGLPAGTYTVTVTDDDGCEGETTVTITDPPLLDASGNSTQDVDCNNPTGSISTTVSGGTGGYSYQWSPNGSGANPSGLIDGTYIATVTDANGCTDTLSAIVAIDTLSPVAAAAANGVLDCIQTSINISGNGSDTGPNISYQWSGPGIVSGGNTINPTVNAPGTYTITVTNTLTGCTETATAAVTEDITPPVAVGNAPPITCANSTIVIDGVGSDTGPNISYQWTGPGIVSGGSTISPTVDQGGNYTFTVTNSINGCETTISVNVPEDLALPVAIANAPPITCNDTSVSIDGVGSETGPNVSYQWTGPGIVSGGTTLNPVVDQPGTYTLTVVDGGNGCENTVSVTVDDQTQLPNAVANADPITCANPTISIDGNGSSTGPGYTYNWTTNDGNIVSGGNSINPTVNQAGTYTLTVVNGQTGCENMVSVTVGEDLTPPVAEAGPPYELTCAVTDIQLDGTGTDTGANYNYQWTGPGVVSGGNTLQPTVNQPGTYSISVINSQNGCETIDQVVVTQDITLPTAVGNAPPITCDVPGVTINGTGSSTGSEFGYQWTGPGIISGATTLNPTVDQPGTYTLTVLNNDNGCEQTASVTVQDLTQLPNAVATASPLTCAQTSISISGNGSSTGPQYTYQWTTNDGNIVSGATQLNPLVDETGTYTLLVENTSTGCENLVSVLVPIDTIPPDANAGADMEINCANPTIQLNGGGSSAGVNISYSWIGPGVISGQSSANPTVNAPGIYTIIVTNSDNGCESSDQVEVTPNFIPPDLVIAPADLITCYVPEIQLDASASDSGPNYSYQWTTNGGVILTGSNTPTPTVGSGGQYTLTLTNNQNGCDSQLNVIVPEDTTPPIADAGPYLEITCVLQEFPLFGFNSSQGPNFSYLWTTSDGNIISGETTLNPVVNEQGTYTLTVTNTFNGCESTSSTDVGIDSNVPIANAGPNQTITCTSSTLTLNGSASSSGPGYTYSWATSNGNILGGANTLTPLVDQPGLYELTVINLNNGCVAYSFANVNEDIILPTATILPPGEVNCNTPQITLDATGSSANGNYSYIWNTANGNIISGQGTLQPVVDQGGNYLLTIINNDTGCLNGTNVVVSEAIDNPILVIDPPGLISCTEPEIILDASGSTSGPEFQYIWTTSDGNIVSGENTSTPTISTGGTYELTIINQNTNCSTTDLVVVPENADLPIVNITPVSELNCSVNQIQLDANIGGGANLSFSWTTPDGNFISGTNTLQPAIDAPGNYQLVVTNDDTGCENSSSVNVTQDVQIPVADAGPDSLLNCVVTALNLDGINSEPGGNINYQWSTPDGNIVSGGNTTTPLVDAPGTYVLVVLNADNTCVNSDTVFISEDVSIPGSVILPPVLMGCQDPIVTIDASGSSSGSSLVYEWTTPDGNIISGGDGLLIDVDAPGSYSLLVLDTINGCFSNAETTVVQNTQIPVVDAGLGGELTCTVTSIQLQAAVSGQVANYEYLWTTVNGNIVSGNQDLMPVVDQAGTYTLLVTNTVNQCTADSSVVVTQDANLPEAVIEPSNTLNCIFSTATLDGSASTQGADLIYSWSTPDGNFVGNPSGLMPLVDQPGTYTLTINDTINSCVTSETILLLPDTLSPILGIAPPDILNCYNPSISLEASTNGLADISLSWSTLDGNITANADSLNPSVNQPGTYTLSVINNQNGCASLIETLVDADFDPPTVDAGPTATLDCTLTEFVLEGTADAGGQLLEYQWTSIDGNILSGADTPMPTVNAGGTYSLSVTNTNNGCSSNADVSIAQDQNLPVADPGPPGLLNCYTPQINLDGTASSIGPDYSYQWSTTDGNILSGDDGLEPNVDAPGTYILTVSNGVNDCESIDTVLVSEDFTIPVADAGQNSELTCSITSLALNGSGSTGTEFSYSWTTPDGNIISGADTPNPIIDQAGTYVLEVLNEDNGCAITAQTDVSNAVSVPVAVASLDGLLNCTIQSLELDGTGSDTGSNFEYSWTSLDGNIASGANTLNPLVDQPGIYTLSVTNLDNDCVSMTNVDVPIDTLAPSAEAGPPGLLTCTVLNLNLDGTGSSVGAEYNYSWTTADGNILSGTGSLSPMIDQPGTYEVLVTNQENGCEALDVVVVAEDVTLPVAQSDVLDILTCVQTSVSLSGAGSSQGADISYNWSTLNGNIVTGQSGLMPEVNQPGQYTLTVLNGFNGCEAETMVDVEQDIANPIVDAGTSGLLTCAVTSLSLNGNASGNNAALDYLWTSPDGNILSGATSLNPAIDQPGTYQLFVTDLVNGCTEFDVIVVEQDIIPPSLLIANPGLLTCDQEQITLDASASSNGLIFLPNWSTLDGNILTGANSLQINIDQPGTYYLEILNSDNGCTSNDEVVVLEDVAAPIVDAGIGFVLPCFDEESFLTGSAIANGVNLIYEWTTLDGQIESNGNTLQPTISSGGVYTLSVSNPNNGCWDSDWVEITENFPFDPDFAIEQPLCSDDLGSLEVLGINAGTPPYVYSIDNGLTFFSSTIFAGLDEGWYSIIVQDALGCESEAVDAYIDIPDPLVIEIGAQVTILQGESQQLQVLLNVPEDQVQEVIWTPSLGLSCIDCLDPIASPLSTTIYQVEVILFGDCRTLDEVEIVVDERPAIYAPNIFSPDGDGDNDLFYLFARPGNIRNIKSFLVFSRWGETVFSYYNFQPNDPAFGWNGNFRGQPLNPAVFVWYAEVELIDGRIELFKGDVTIVR